MDVSYCRQLLQDILSSPHDEARRVAPIRDIRSPWVRKLLAIVGFLPDDSSSLVLVNDGNKIRDGFLCKSNLLIVLLQLCFVAAVNLYLLQNALSVVTGVELAVSRSAIPMQPPAYVVFAHYSGTSEQGTLWGQ